MPRGKKELAEQIIPDATSVEVRLCTGSSRCSHDTSRIACVFKRVLLTSSSTAALEMAAMLCNLGRGRDLIFSHGLWIKHSP